MALSVSSASSSASPSPGIPVRYGGRPVSVSAACWAILAKAVLGVVLSVLAIWFQPVGAFVGPATLALTLLFTLVLALPLGLGVAAHAAMVVAAVVVGAGWVTLALLVRSGRDGARITAAVLLFLGSGAALLAILFLDGAALVGNLAVVVAMTTAAGLLLSREAREWARAVGERRRDPWSAA